MQATHFRSETRHWNQYTSILRRTEASDGRSWFMESGPLECGLKLMILFVVVSLISQSTTSCGRHPQNARQFRFGISLWLFGPHDISKSCAKNRKVILMLTSFNSPCSDPRQGFRSLPADRLLAEGVAATASHGYSADITRRNRAIHLNRSTYKVLGYQCCRGSEDRGCNDLGLRV